VTKPFFPSDVINYATKAFLLSREDVLSAQRARPLVLCRGAIAGALRARGVSYSSIGRMLNRDHSSIIHYCDALYRDYLTDPRYGPLVRVVLDRFTLDQETFGAAQQVALAKAVEHANLKKSACKVKLQKVAKAPQQRRYPMLHPEKVEQEIASALKRAKLRSLEVLWDGAIIERDAAQSLQFRPQR